MGIIILFDSDLSLTSNEAVLRAFKIVIYAICILIVAIPEGLPLAVSIAMAMSIDRLKKDNLLIKNLESVQKCAMLHDICVGKTGVVTRGDLQVKKF